MVSAVENGKERGLDTSHGNSAAASTNEQPWIGAGVVLRASGVPLGIWSAHTSAPACLFVVLLLLLLATVESTRLSDNNEISSRNMSIRRPSSLCVYKRVSLKKERD